MAGTSFILPNASQLYADEDTYVGNPDLKPEESLNFDFGVGIKRGLFNFEAGYFYQEIKDLIALTSTGAEIETYENVGGKSEYKGFDLMFGVGPWHGAGIVLSYTNVEATKGDSGEQLDNVPKNLYKARLYWRHDLGNALIGTDINANYVGNVEAYDTNYGDYWMANWSIFYKFGEKRRHMFTLRAENLFDEQYYSRLGRTNDTDGNRFVYGYEGIPFNVMLGYSFTF